MKKPAYPILMQLMSKHGITRKDVSKIINLSYRQTLKKINREKTGKSNIALFDLEEAWEITKYFRDRGEEITIEEVFSLNKRDCIVLPFPHNK